MSRLAILGAGGHGQVVAEAAEEAGWDEIVFFDQRWREIEAARNLASNRWTVAGTWEDFLAVHSSFAGVIVGIGNSAARLSWLDRLTSMGVSVSSITHPRSIVSRYAQIGLGTVVFAGAVVQARAQIGKGCIVNSNATVEHDCMLADGVHVCPGASLAGGVIVAENSWIGIGSAVRETVKIGQRSTVGAGAVVVKDVPDDVTVVGVPARILERSRSNAQ